MAPGMKSSENDGWPVCLKVDVYLKSRRSKLRNRGSGHFRETALLQAPGFLAITVEGSIMHIIKKDED